jgi:hypothetical protein
MAEIRQYQTQLEQTNERSKTVTRSEEMHALRESMQRDASSISRVADAIKKRLAELERANEAALKRKGCERGSSTERTRSAITSALKKKLKDQMDEFQDLRARLQREYREVVERRVFTGAPPRAQRARACCGARRRMGLSCRRRRVLCAACVPSSACVCRVTRARRGPPPPPPPPPPAASLAARQSAQAPGWLPACLRLGGAASPRPPPRPPPAPLAPPRSPRSHGAARGRGGDRPPDRGGRGRERLPERHPGAGARLRARHAGGDPGAARGGDGAGAVAAGAAPDLPGHGGAGGGAGADDRQHRGAGAGRVGASGGIFLVRGARGGGAFEGGWEGRQGFASGGSSSPARCMARAPVCTAHAPRPASPPSN